MKYLVPSSHVIRQEVKAGCMESGFIVTQDGYIVTNAHVVYASDKDLKEMLAQDGLQKIIQQDMQGLKSELSGQGYSVPDDVLAKLQRAVIKFYAQHLEVSNVKQQVYASFGMESRTKGIACEVCKRGEPAPGKDIAILKAAKENLPVVQLGDDKALKTGDKIFVLGYPGAATFNQFLAQDAKLESSFTAGMVSARKTMPENWDVLQIDAAITHGNSGGPVFDEKGSVVGVVTFGSLDEQGSMVQGMNFAIPVSIVKEFLHDLGVEAKSGELEQNYRTAVRAYDQGQYEDALEAFTELHERVPDFPYVQEFITEAKENMNKNQ